MLLLQEINKQVTEFNNYMNYTEIPFIEDIIYIEDLDSNPNAKIDFNDLIKNKYIIYLNKRLDKFPYKYQISVIWHELTHIFDFVTYKNKYKNIHELLKSYSESHAISIQLKYLADLKLDDKITNSNKEVYYQDKIQSLAEISLNYFNRSCLYILKYFDTKNLLDFSESLNYFCYFCGYLTARSNSQTLFKGAMKKYPNNNYKNILIMLGESILSRNIQHSVKLYTDMYLKEIEVNKRLITEP